MKKSLLALAVMGAFAGAAQAQSNVTVYGSFDAGVRNQTNTNAAGDSRLTMGSNGTYTTNRIGFKGVEDLGGGMNAHFTLESGFNSGNGTLDNTSNMLFQRTASVGLGGAWGSLDLGRQYTVAFRTQIAYDPMNVHYTGITNLVPASASNRFNNDIQYTGTFGPVTARAEYALGEVAGDRTQNSAQAIGAVYADGPVTVGAAYTKRDFTNLDNKHWTVGGAYKFGPARVAVGYADEKQENTVGGDSRVKYMWAGLSYAITPALEITPAWYRTKYENVTSTVPAVVAPAAVSGIGGDGKKDLYMLSLTYAFSKRTNFYALIDQARLDGNARIGNVQDRQTDVAVGINHLF